MEGKPPESTPGYTPPPEDYKPQYQSSFPGTRPGLSRFQKTDKLVQIIALGLFLMFIGAAIMTMVMVSRPPDEWDEKYDNDENGNIDMGEYDDYIKDYRGYKALRTVGLILGGVLLELGLLLLLVALLGGAIVNKDLDNYSRLGMIIAASIIVALEMFFLTKLMELPYLLTLNP
jgi:hypothetical protein